MYMDPQSINSQPAPPPPLEPTHKSRLPKFIIIILALILVIFAGIAAYFTTQNKPTSIERTTQQSSDKSWEIILGFNRSTRSLSVKNFSLVNQAIVTDARGADNSKYRLLVLDSKGLILYSTKVNISEDLIYNLLYKPDASGTAVPVPPDELISTIYLPYFEQATDIRITKDDKAILQIQVQNPTDQPKKQTWFNFIPKVHAQINNPPSGGPLQAVFISDGYTDMSTYHQDVEYLKSVLNSAEPYASANPRIISFQIVDNSEPLGCGSSILDCIGNPKIKQISYAKFPNASKFIVLVNDPLGRSVSKALGVANGVGGDVGVFTNYRAFGEDAYRNVAIHEFLGHMVGELNDRYVMKNPNPGLLSVMTPANCSSSPQGESLWASVGVTQAFSGCTFSSRYAPAPVACPASSNDPMFINGGSRDTVMSAVGCGGTVFDAVETNWIKTRIIPKYQTASTSNPASDPLPPNEINNPPSSSNPIPIGSNGNGVIKGTVWNDTNRNGVKDNGEAGVANVDVGVYLYHPNGPIKSANTDSTGNYLINGLGSQEYLVQVHKPDNYEWTTQATIYANAGQFTGVNTNEANFGLAALATLSGLIFVDDNRNGVKEPGEQNYQTPTSICFDFLQSRLTGNILSRQHCSGPSANLTPGAKLDPSASPADLIIPNTTNTQGTFQLKGYSGGYLATLAQIPAGYILTTSQNQNINISSGSGIVNFGIVVGTNTNTGATNESNGNPQPNSSNQPAPTGAGQYICEEVSQPSSSGGQQIQIKTLRCEYR
jgi:hypothetical protein